MMATVKTTLEFPEKMAPLFTPAPYKIVWGGRGKGASWSIARALLILGNKRPLFIVCAREVQRSIKDSVHKLLSDQIVSLKYYAHKDNNGNDVPAFYEVLDTEIRGKNGTVFVFVGLNNVQSIKSMEGIDVLWVTEATFVPKSKWDVVCPTVRRDPPFGPFKQGSEIWIDFNPELSSDDTYQMYVVDPPDDAIVIHANYMDNPFFPEFLRKQMEQMKRKNHDDYLCVWEGRTRKALQGAIFATELRAAIEDERVGPHIKWDPKRPVTVSFDLGDSDMTAMWVWQQMGNEHSAVFYHEENAQDIVYFLDILQRERFIIKRVLLPHDADQQHQSARRLGTLNTIAKQARAFFPTPGVVKVTQSTSLVIQINATRALLPRVCINDVRCDRGVLCLQHYQYDVDQETGKRSKKPLHNWASHGASAFMQYCTHVREGVKQEREQDTGVEDRESKFGETHSQGWMA